MSIICNSCSFCPTWTEMDFNKHVGICKRFSTKTIYRYAGDFYEMGQEILRELTECSGFVSISEKPKKTSPCYTCEFQPDWESRIDDPCKYGYCNFKLPEFINRPILVNDTSENYCSFVFKPNTKEAITVPIYKCPTYRNQSNFKKETVEHIQTLCHSCQYEPSWYRPIVGPHQYGSCNYPLPGDLSPLEITYKFNNKTYYYTKFGTMFNKFKPLTFCRCFTPKGD